VRHSILWNSERKRESNDIFELPESKKPRLCGDGQDDLTIPVVADMKSEAKSQGAEKSQGKTQSKRTTDGGGSFKENPYTFLAPNDPILLTCMYVALLFIGDSSLDFVIEVIVCI